MAIASGCSRPSYNFESTSFSEAHTLCDCSNTLSLLYLLFKDSGGTISFSDWLQIFNGIGDANIFYGRNYPDDLLGNNDDYFVDTSNWIVYVKNDEEWLIIENLSLFINTAQSIENVPKHYSLKICSYNIGHYCYGLHDGYDKNDSSEKIDSVKGIFSEIGADILCLQEDTQFFDDEHIFESKKCLFDPIYNYSGVVYDAGLNNNVFSRYKIDDFTVGLLKDGVRAYTRFKIKIDDKIINFFNFHLSTDIEERNGNFGEILSIIQNVDNVVMCGDWNIKATAEFDALTNNGYRLSNGGYRDFVSTYGDHCEYFDNIIVSSNIFVSNFYVPDVYFQGVSDHLPIVSEIVIY